MYSIGVIGRRLMSTACRGVKKSSHSFAYRPSTKWGQLPVHTALVQGILLRNRPWPRSSAVVLADAQQQALQHGPMYSSLAALNSISSPTELSAAIADAPTHAALQSLAAAASAPQLHWLAQEYKVQLLSDLEQQQPSELVKILLFYAKLGPGHDDLFIKAVPVLYNNLGQLQTADLLRLLMAYATASQHSSAVYSQELFAALTEFLWESLGQYTPADLADIAAAYAAVEHYDDDEDFFSGLAAAAVEKLESFCPEDLSRLCWSLSYLRFNAADLNTAALQQLSNQLELWSLSCIGKLLFAIARVQALPDPCILERIAGHVSIVLRNLRTSTDGKKVLQSLASKQQAEDSSSSSSSSSGVLGMHRAGSSSWGSAAGAFGGPTWQGFGVTRSSSSNSSSSGISSSSSAAGNSSSSSDCSVSSDSSISVATIFEAASASSINYEYSEDTPLGPEFLTVTNYNDDGRVVTTYIRRDTADGRTSISSGSSRGLVPPPVAASVQGMRALSSNTSSSSNVHNSISRGSWYDQARAGQDECPIAGLQSVTVPDNCRPVYDTAEALQCALVNMVWGFAMLGHLHGNMARECFRALGLAAVEAFSEEQLVMLWAAHMRYQQLGHVMLDPNPLLADSYSVFHKEVSRAAPRNISLPMPLQAVAAASYLLYTIVQSPEYQQLQSQQQQQQQQQSQRLRQLEEQQDHQHQQFSSWKFRDPAVLTLKGLEASVRQSLQQLGLPVGAPCITLDGVERVGLPMKHNGVSVAWQVIPPAWCSRNPPYHPTSEAQMHKWALQYRGYTVLQVPFYDWASVLESGDSVVQAGYLQNMLNGLSVRVPKMPASF